MHFFIQERYNHAMVTASKKTTHTDELASYSSLLQTLLRNRGVVTAEGAKTFLSPDYDLGMHDPFLMHDMERAVIRMYEAIEAKQKIVIYSDYDCDGIPGAVVMHDFLKKVNCTNFHIYIPHRHDEGYGLHRDAVDQFIAAGTNLIFTIDLGITAVEEVAHAQISGVDVIVTDHHLPQEVVPKAYAVVNPKLGAYPDPMLCGAGVAFKFVQAFIQKYAEYYDVKPGWEKWLLDMAGLATLSDMVPLRDENRTIASFGLTVLRKSPRPGLMALLAVLKIDQRYLTEDDVGFMITPRINAASRMDDPVRAFELLATTDPVEAKVLAQHLSSINDQRKSIVAQMMKEVYATLEKREIGEIIVIGNPDWRAGVLGLVAGKISDEYGKPAFVWGQADEDNEEGIALVKGSCRSPGGINVVALMTAATEAFAGFGGHELAGGFSVVKTEVHLLESRLLIALPQALFDKAEAGSAVDMTLTLADVTRKNYADIASLAPFGVANPKPVFLFEGVTVRGVKLFGKEKNHIELALSQNGTAAIAIAFFKTAESFSRPVAVGDNVSLVASFDFSRFAGRELLRLRIVDIL